MRSRPVRLKDASIGYWDVLMLKTGLQSLIVNRIVE